VVLVKYDSSGTAIWARTVTTGAHDSGFGSIAVDSDGNIYAAGGIAVIGNYDFGGGVVAGGTYGSNKMVLVKYDSAGTAQWARTDSTGMRTSGFGATAVDSAGNAYAAGFISGTGTTGTYTFGSGVTAVGTNTGPNVVLVKYNSSGGAIWARTVTTGTSDSKFHSAAVDASGNVYTTGYISGTGTYSFGSGVTAAGSGGGHNVVLAKYDSSGMALWARTVSTGTANSEFLSTAVDSSANIYAAGIIYGTESRTFGSGVTAAGTNTGYNVVLVRYLK